MCELCHGTDICDSCTVILQKDLAPDKNQVCDGAEIINGRKGDLVKHRYT